MTAKNDLKRKLAADEPTIGVFLESLSPRAAEVIAACGVDWVGIDMEHTSITMRDVEDVVRAVELHGASSVVRLPSVGAAVEGGCKRALDVGAHGVIVPRVETASQAEAVVAAARFPPAGERGVAGSVRANEYGSGFDDYVARANDEILVVVQLETAAAALQASDILAVDGIDVAFVGENDLSATHGLPGRVDDPAVQADVGTILEHASTAGVHAGIAARTPASLAERRRRGFRFFLLGGDLGILRRGIQAFTSDARSGG